MSFMGPINNYPRDKLRVFEADTSLPFFSPSVLLSFERYCLSRYNDHQCPAPEHRFEGRRFLSVGGFIIATGGTVGDRVDEFVAASRSWLESTMHAVLGTGEKHLPVPDVCHRDERYRAVIAFRYRSITTVTCRQHVRFFSSCHHFFAIKARRCFPSGCIKYDPLPEV